MSRILERRYTAIILAAVIFLTAPSDAHAYIDPGTGGMLLQLLLGGIAGALVIIKLYWQRLRMAVGRLFGNRPPSEKTERD